MSSTILYKFRASSTFEALPLPGSAARLFDVKKAIVKANKLDAGSMEFDLAVRNADTNEEYADESMLLPRGTRIIVQRLPAARGHGFLARMARNDHGGGIGSSFQHQQQQHPSGYYTIDSRVRENEEEEFVDNVIESTETKDDKELAALQAVTSMQAEGPTMVGGQSSMMAAHRLGRGGPPRPAGMGAPPPKTNFHANNSNTNLKTGTNFRPNADPELREHDKKLMPKKRATGIPRTFLSLSAPPQTDGGKEGGEGEQQTPLLQPNKQGFKELVSRGGGQSESTAGTRRDLDYALKLTSTTIPEHLRCAVCNNVVKNAMLLPWDSEGRTVCETCIRDALTQNGFRCPLTGMDGVSPDDLIPNVGLRKAAEMFIKGVMAKVDEIEQEQVEEPEAMTEETTVQSSERDVLDGQGAEKGVLVSKRMTLMSRKKSDDDPFGSGGDDFGGDVFAIDGKIASTEELEISDKKDVTTAVLDIAEIEKESKPSNEERNEIDGKEAHKTDAVSLPKANDGDKDKLLSPNRESSPTSRLSNGDSAKSPTEGRTKSPNPATTSSHMRFHRRRGPPVGYTMGPAGGAAATARVSQNSNNNFHGNKSGQNYNRGGRGVGRSAPRGGARNDNHYLDRSSGGGSYGNARGGRDRGRGNYRHDGDQQENHSAEGEYGRGTKRGRDDHDEDNSRDAKHHRDRGGKGKHRHERGGRGSSGRGSGGYKGARGGRSWGGHHRGNTRGDRGNYADRDRY